MKKSTVAVCLIVSIFILQIAISLFLSRCDTAKQTGISSTGEMRIVSLSPGITEMLYALGLSNEIAGVTTYCDYPPDAVDKPKIGGYYDPNIEQVTQIQPTWVIAETTHQAVADALRKLNVPVITIDNRSPEKIIDSIGRLGKLLGREIQARKLISSMQKKLNRFSNLTRTLPHPYVLLVFGYEMTGTPGEKIYCVGNDTFYTPLLTYIGARNAGKQFNVPYALLSQEGIIQLNPDIIIELRDETSGQTTQTVRQRWSAMSMLEAVKEGRIYVLNGDYIIIPGPRFIQTAEDLLALVHPQLKDAL